MKVISEPITVPATSPHQTPESPQLSPKAKIKAKRGVMIRLRKSVAIRALVPFPAPWKKEAESIPKATAG